MKALDGVYINDIIAASNNAREGYRFVQATHPHEVEAWEGACAAQRMLTNTDPVDALADIED